jgi:RNA polymerase sigma factor (sigma-70 family)
MCLDNGNIDEYIAELNAEVAAVAFSFLERRRDGVVRLCKIILRGTKGISLDEALSESIFAAMRGVETFKQNGASLDTHLFEAIKWYLIKHFKTRTPQREQAHRDKLFEHTSKSSLQYVTNDDADQLQRVWEQLSQDDAAMLELRYIYEMEFSEIAEIFECSNSHAYKKVNEALEKARRLYKDG